MAVPFAARTPVSPGSGLQRLVARDPVTTFLLLVFTVSAAVAQVPVFTRRDFLPFRSRGLRLPRPGPGSGGAGFRRSGRGWRPGGSARTRQPFSAMARRNPLVPVRIPQRPGQGP